MAGHTPVQTPLPAIDVIRPGAFRKLADRKGGFFCSERKQAENELTEHPASEPGTLPKSFSDEVALNSRESKSTGSATASRAGHVVGPLSVVFAATGERERIDRCLLKTLVGIGTSFHLQKKFLPSAPTNTVLLFPLPAAGPPA